jgi:hypothetical protein
VNRTYFFISIGVSVASVAATLIILWALEGPEVDIAPPLPFMLAASETRLVELPPKEICVDEKSREEIRALTLAAIDAGFIGHVSHLFEVWVRDPAEQPKRAKVGLQAGISAYLRARKDALKWDPPACVTQ